MPAAAVAVVAAAAAAADAGFGKKEKRGSLDNSKFLFYMNSFSRV